MAFFKKAGSILQQAVSKQHINLEISASKPSIFQLFRCMSTKLFVGGTSWTTNDNTLHEAFSKYGEVIEARIIYDRETGRSRGFGFVTFSSSEDASAAIQALDGQELDGRTIRVNISHGRTRGYSGDGSGFGGGNYGGGGYGGGGGGNDGSGGYGGGGGGNYGSGGYGGHGSNYGSGSYGGGGNYGGAGGVDANAASNYGSGEQSFGFGTSAGNNFSSGDSFASGATDAASNSFTSSFSNSDQLGNDASSNQAEIDDVNGPVDADENYRAENVESDYADRRA